MMRVLLLLSILASPLMAQVVDRVSVSPPTITLVEGDTSRATCTPRNRFDAILTLGCTWTVSDSSFMAMIGSGQSVQLTGDDLGSAWVTATVGGKSARLRLRVADTLPATPPPPPTLVAIELTPASDTIAAGSTQQFTVQGRTSTGGLVSLVSPTPTFSATGGTISVGGLYTAAGTGGTFRAIATSGSFADTAAILVTAPPTLALITLSPASAALATGGQTRQFSVSGVMSDGTPASGLTPSYSATGGTISGGGLYTSGSTAGTFRVISTEEALADTSAVTLTAPAPPPTACTPTVTVATLAGFTSAISSAVPGACILVAPGTYIASAAIRFTRSGTAALPITIEGAGIGTTVFDMNDQEITAEQVSYVRLRKMRITDLPLRGFWWRNSHWNVLDSVQIDNAQHEAIAFKNLSKHNTIKNCVITNTGVTHANNGEGVYVGGSAEAGFPQDFGVTGNEIIGCHIGPEVRAQAVDVSPGADSTIIRNNTIDGTGTVCNGTTACGVGFGTLVDIIASHVIIEGNTISKGAPNAVRFVAPANYTMTGVIARNNTIDLQNIHGFTGSFHGFNLTVNTNQPGRVTIKCSNAVTNGSFSNVACVP